MPFEDFDNKIRQAAEQHHPNYDEMAWSKMNGLLDKHLPQKEDRRRRIIFFLLAFLLLGGGATWLLIDKPWQQNAIVNGTTSHSQSATGTDASAKSVDVSSDNKDKTNPASELTTNDQAVKDPKANPPTDINSTDAGTTATDLNTSTSKTAVPGDNGSLASSVTGNNSKGPQKNAASKSPKTKDTDSQFQVNTLQGNIGKGKQTSVTTGQTDKEVRSSPDKNNEPSVLIAGGDTKPVVSDNKTTQTVLPPATDLTSTTKINASPKDSSFNNQPKADEVTKTAKKDRNKKANQFFFSLSAGPDVSSVGKGNPGKMKLLTGAGLGYTFKDRLTIRTGFYTASKVYTARPADYKPSVPVQNVNYLENISANCKVYEIPFSLSYNFGKSEKHKTFISAGLSSFIMKKETYDYIYKYPGVPDPIIYTHTYNNENKHYFSVLSLSAGYQKRINRILSVTAEPYFKLPLAGVGNGKVKLNSYGVMFSLNVSPFASKK